MKNPNELSATSSWRGNELQLIEQKANIVVGVQGRCSSQLS